MCSALPTLPTALEHDVLEQVGEAGLAGDLVLRPDPVPDVDRDDGREVVLGDDQAEAVGQALVGEGDDRDGHAADRISDEPVLAAVRRRAAILTGRRGRVRLSSNTC